MNKSKELVDQAARLIYTDAPYIMLCYPKMLQAYRKDCLEGWGEDLTLWSYSPFDRLKPI
ncbi:MAG: hypothetical protein E5X61_38430 [Mesorhizobium sp.]|nr:MAG: hypothetical protein E5X61_38430 [Mesorhizobium sp.]